MDADTRELTRKLEIKTRRKEILSALSGKLEIKSREEISQKFLKGNWASVTKMAAN